MGSGGACGIAAKRAVKWNVLPRPTSPSTEIRPSINAISLEEIVNPRPVPPYFRVVEPSACSNGSKMARCLSAGIPIPVSATAKRRPTESPDGGCSLDGDDDLALLGEFDGIADEIDQDLTEPPRVPGQRVGHVGRDAAGQFQALGVGPLREGAQGVFHGHAEAERGDLEVELARLDLREVEDVVDHRQQGVGRRLDQAQVFALLGRELRVQHQLGHADDAVHRGPDLVAHVGQELALGPGGRLGGLLGLTQPGLRPLAFGDVAGDGGDELDVAVRIFMGDGDHRDGDLAPVASQHRDLARPRPLPACGRKALFATIFLAQSGK